MAWWIVFADRIKNLRGSIINRGGLRSPRYEYRCPLMIWSPKIVLREVSTLQLWQSVVTPDNLTKAVEVRVMCQWFELVTVDVKWNLDIKTLTLHISAVIFSVLKNCSQTHPSRRYFSCFELRSTSAAAKENSMPQIFSNIYFNDGEWGWAKKKNHAVWTGSPSLVYSSRFVSIYPTWLPFKILHWKTNLT